MASFYTFDDSQEMEESLFVRRVARRFALGVGKFEPCRQSPDGYSFATGRY